VVHIYPAVIAALVASAGVYAFQRLKSNREGSEADVGSALHRLPRGVWTFVAMQYYFGTLNRTYLVFVTPKMICGAKVKGAVAAPIAPDPRWNDPLFYVAPDKASRYASMDVDSEEFVKSSRANFQVPLSDIREVEFSQEPKWGMGRVPIRAGFSCT
jgi:hypothetical protein